MDNSFFAYLQQLELVAFFSGYPLLYALVLFISGNKRVKSSDKGRIPSVLPFAYALTGTLYLGLQLKNFYPDYSIDHLKQAIQLPWLMGWAILSMLFWVPFFGKKPFYSLIHSLVFFFFFIRDLFMSLTASSGDKSIIRNDMKLYTVSLLLNLGAFILIWLLSFLISRYKRR